MNVYLVRCTRYRAAYYTAVNFRWRSTTPCQVARIVERANLIQQKEAWRRWRYHLHYLTVVSNRVRGQVHLAVLSCRWHQWITAGKKRTRRCRALQRRVVEMGVRVVVKRRFLAWKTSVQVTRTRIQLAEERHQIWLRVNVWLTQQ